MIAITMDVDWVPDAVLADSLELLAAHSVRATIFMTHRAGVDVSGHELAIHPHFTTFDFERHLRERLEDVPGARGTRSHALFDTYRLQELYERLGLTYQSNVMIYGQPNLRPYRISPAVVEAPIFFMDNIDILMRNGRGPSTLGELELARPGLKVFDFHPIHVFLNTDSMERYAAAKPAWRDVGRLRELRNTSRRGVRDVFLDVLQAVGPTQGTSPTLAEVTAAAGASP